MMRFALMMLVLVAVCGCGARQKSTSVQRDEAPAQPSVSDETLQDPATEQSRSEVLRNAALLYRQNHAAWPQRIEEVAPYVHDIDAYESITFTRRPLGELVMRYRLKRQIAEEGGGVVS